MNRSFLSKFLTILIGGLAIGFLAYSILVQTVLSVQSIKGTYAAAVYLSFTALKPFSPKK